MAEVEPAVKVRVPMFAVDDGALERPRAGGRLTTGLGLILPPEPSRAPEGPDVVTITGSVRQAAHLKVLIGSYPIVLMGYGSDVVKAGADLSLRGQLVAEPYLWGCGEQSPLREQFRHGWRTWVILETELDPDSTVGDVFALIEPLIGAQA